MNENTQVTSPTQNTAGVNNQSSAFVNNNSSIFKKILNPKIGIIVFILVIGILAILFLSNSANRVSSLKFTVLDKQTGQKINSSIKVYINNSGPFESSDGQFTFPKVSAGNYTVKVQAPSYLEYSSTINIPSIDIKNTYEFSIALDRGKNASITGTFITGKQNYSFINDVFKVNNKIYSISSDGKFTLTDLFEGEVRMVFESSNYKDFDTTFTIKAGNNTLQDVVLEPKADIVGDLKSFIREDNVFNVQITVQGIEDKFIIKNLETQKFRIKDLNIGNEYAVRIKLEGYNTRDYKIIVKQGENLIPKFNITEAGKSVYVKADQLTRGNQIYIADHDGLNEEQLTNFNRFEPQNIEYNEKEERIYFLSDHEKIKGLVSGNIIFPYYYDIKTRTINKMFADISNLGVLFVNYKSKVIANVIPSKTVNVRGAQDVEVINLNNGSRKIIKTIENGSFGQFKIADSLTALYFVETDNLKKTTVFYKYSLLDEKLTTVINKTSLYLLDTSYNGESILYLALNTSTNFLDLFISDTKTNITKTLETNIKGAEYKFIDNSNDVIVYFKKQSGILNVFQLNINSNKEDQITRLAPNDIIYQVFDENNYLYYLTDKGLYILSFDSPKSFKLVNESVKNVFRQDN